MKCRQNFGVKIGGAIEIACLQTGCVECETLDFAVTDLIVTNDHCVSGMSIGDRATFKTYFELVDAEQLHVKYRLVFLSHFLYFLLPL